MQRKRLLCTTAAALLSAFTLCTAVYAEGSAEAEKETAPVTVTALKGPTAMGMVKLMDDSDQGISEGTYEFSILSAVDEVTPLIAQGKTDIAAVPANLASVLYNNTDGTIEVLAINTLGVLYIVEDGDSIAGVEDLRGKTIYVSGKGATPEYALNYILQENGIDPASDVTIEWKSEHAECLAALTEAEGGIAMLPQPFVTTAQTKMENLRVALDLTQEWEKTQEGEENPSQLITGVVVAKTSFIEEYPEKVDTFLAEYAESVAYVKENTAEAAALVGGYDIVPEAVAKKAIPECSITYIDGADMKTALSGYLAVLEEQNPQSVGGTLPDDSFYYIR